MTPKIQALSFLLVAGACVLRAGPAAADATPASASLAWNRIALEAVERAKPSQHVAIRLMAHVSLAQHIASLQATDEASAPDAVATASMRVIAGLLPSQAAFASERHDSLRKPASEVGERIAKQVLASAQADGFAQPWKGAAPGAAYAWHSLAQPAAAPAFPAIGAMRTFLVESGDAFRPAPPPAVGSARFLQDLAEVRSHTNAPTDESTRIAKFYDMTTGTMVAGFWNEQATERIRRDGLPVTRATTILATVNAAMMDAVVACHDAKYVYWVPRPSQADPSIKPIIGVPNHPSYPSNHSCISTAAGIVLAHFFPRDREALERFGMEAGLSRIYAGIHYRFDVDAGDEIGRKVAASAITRHADMLARWTRTTVGWF